MAENFSDLLISLVRRRRLLWDRSHKNYHNRLMVDRHWKGIAAELGETKLVVKTKWKNLRDHFKKELRKVPKNRYDIDGKEPRYLGSWCHFKTMLFLSELKPKAGQSIAAPESINNGIQSQDEDLRESDDEATDSEDSTSLVEPQSPPSGPSTSSSKPPLRLAKTQPGRLQRQMDELERNGLINTMQIPSLTKYKTQANAQPNFEREMLELEGRKVALMEERNHNHDDEDLYFFKSLLPHVKLLPSYNKLFFRSQVQDLLANELCKIQGNLQRLPHDPNNSFTENILSPSQIIMKSEVVNDEM